MERLSPIRASFMASALLAFVCLLAPGQPALGQDASDEQAKRIDELIQDLGDPERDMAARGSLRALGPAALPALIEALNDRDDGRRRGAAAALCDLGPAAAPAVPALIKSLNDPVDQVRGWAAAALGEVGPAAAPAVPALIEALGDPRPGTRTQAFATVALGHLGAAAASAVPALIEDLESSEYQQRLAAADALDNIGSSLKAQGTVLWWVVPYAHRWELAGFLLLIVGWFALAARFPRHRPADKLKQAVLFALTAAVPSALACGAVYHAVTRDWARSFLADPVGTVLPLEITAVLSVGFVCVLSAVGVSWWKPRVPGGDSAGNNWTGLTPDPSPEI